MLLGALLGLREAAPGDRARMGVGAGGAEFRFELHAGPLAARAAAALGEVAAGGDDVDIAPGPVPDGEGAYSSQPRSWREAGQDLGLRGVRCTRCGTVLYPPAPSCPVDGPAAPLEPVSLARTGTVFTHTRDHVYPFGSPTLMAVAELDGGGRFYGQVTDASEAWIGMPVELVLRVLYTTGGAAQYFWKLRPRTAAREG
jgi:uncharacterized OB-fold protein